jgi:hypothetical protein
MLRSGIRDIEQVPSGARESFFAYFDSIRAVLTAGLRERGRAHTRVSGAIGHAINFLTWHSLVREQQIDAGEAAMLLVAMVEAAGAVTDSAQTARRRCAQRAA